MKAIVWTRYGPPDVLELREVAKPVPKDNEVLVRIHATTVTAGDCEMRSLKLPLLLALPIRLWIGFLKPRGTTIPGTELAGEIEAVGQAVTRFKPGDQVYGSLGTGFGANAEYVCLPEEPKEMEGTLALKPANMTYEQAAAVPFGGRDALHFLRKAGLQAGHKILIVGAGGSIGTFAVQLAKHYGAEVTAVDSGPKLEMLRAIGADHVIDYTREETTRTGETYDVIFDVVGKSPVWRSVRSLQPNGVFPIANPRLRHMVLALWTSLTSGKRAILETASATTADLELLRGLIEADKIASVIDRTYPLEKIVEAHRYVETGQKAGNVVIVV